MKTKEEVKGARSTELEARSKNSKKSLDLNNHKRGQVFHISHFISLILQTCI